MPDWTQGMLHMPTWNVRVFLKESNIKRGAACDCFCGRRAFGLGTLGEGPHGGVPTHRLWSTSRSLSSVLSTPPGHRPRGVSTVG